jgi:hypothetical protein
MNDNSNWIGRRPLGSALLLELKQNPERYKGVDVYKVAGLEILGDDWHRAEEVLARKVADEFLNGRLTFDQDRRIRELIRTLALSHQKWSESRLSLPAGHFYDLDPSKDDLLVIERVKFVNK